MDRDPPGLGSGRCARRGRPSAAARRAGQPTRPASARPGSPAAPAPADRQPIRSRRAAGRRASARLRARPRAGRCRCARCSRRRTASPRWARASWSTTSGLLVTNYHVVSQYALQPGRHRLVYATVDGRQGALQLLAFDVVHDLALLRPADPAPLAGRGAVALRPADEPLPRGARIFSLGNPLDVGFAVAEGSYNGPVERSFLETLFFGGSLSGGMSGGPALDDQGRLIGVNVAARRDGEQVSFLVPAAPVRDAARSAGATPRPSPTPSLDRGDAAAAGPPGRRSPSASSPCPGATPATRAMRIPVPQEQFMRCWGRGSPQAVRGLQFERSDCAMDSRIFVSGSLLTGHLSVRHEAYDGSKLGALRFAERYSRQLPQ
ncbi:MAG: serine protease [Comamonadaceae bacterium]|nr:serine protease [Comamonadaceae bacterium]